MENPFVGGLVSASPYLAGWIIALVFAFVMIRRGGGRAERLLLAGVSMMLVNSLLMVPTVGMPALLIEAGWKTIDIAQAMSIFSLVCGIISLVGIVFLVYAFWLKFKNASPVKMESVQRMVISLTGKLVL